MGFRYVFVGDSLADMYAKCGSIEDEWRLFNEMPSQNVGTWNAMVLGHVKCGQGQKALKLFQQMQQQGVRPNSVTFVGVLKTCANVAVIEEGRCVHQQIIQSGLGSDVFVGSSLVDMYAKCGSIEDARKEGMRPNSVTFVGPLNACARVLALEKGRCVHQQIIQHGLESDVFVESSLVDMYAKCGSLEDAWSVFNKMLAQNVVTWTAMILGHMQCGQGQKALGLFQEMKQEGVDPNSITFVGVLNACASVFALEEGRRVHQEVIQSGLELDVFVRSSLVDMYAKCGSMDDAWRDFNKMPFQNVVTWNTILGGCAMHGHGYVASMKFVLHDVEVEEKAFHLCHHSEKLAIAFGLINTAPGSPLQIRKNLQVCEDCHTSTKFISKILGRGIMMRDANHFHRFENGVCSCMDYW
ncbi:unnamed protein product [Sphagnum jensenii]|uniref:DYW domain-containing protein n=1 Tax=Sphagnum jensenii TaxID=128206 RepID=A0ABP1AZQ3_9BRYO